DAARSRDQAPALDLYPAWARATEFLYAGGIISPSGQTAELRAFYRTTTPDPDLMAHSLKNAAISGTYSLVLEDSGGIPIFTHTFTTSVIDAFGDAPATQVFAEALPYDVRTARIVLREGDVELASRPVSSHAPTVTVTAPNGGETVDGRLSVSWTASDEDDDDLLFTVLYSPDDGATWHSLFIDWPETTVELAEEDVPGLPGSDQARVRVI
ncbi:MAG: hypothetical protein GY842_11515, partial [bacterium]|nr:hypothetical protein [bacterium]